MKFLSWNIDGTSAVLKKCDFMDCLWMWKADIFAFQKTKLREREVGIKFPGYYDYWSFYENCPISHQVLVARRPRCTLYEWILNGMGRSFSSCFWK